MPATFHSMHVVIIFNGTKDVLHETFCEYWRKSRRLVKNYPLTPIFYALLVIVILPWAFGCAKLGNQPNTNAVHRHWQTTEKPLASNCRPIQLKNNSEKETRTDKARKTPIDAHKHDHIRRLKRTNDEKPTRVFIQFRMAGNSVEICKIRMRKMNA